MNIFRVVISFMRDFIHYQQERGVLAMTPGQALDDVFTALQIDRTRINNLKVWVEQPEKLDTFGSDAQFMTVINSHLSLSDLWRRKNMGESLA